MKASDFALGSLVRVTDAPSWAYLTVGQVYRVNYVGEQTIGLYGVKDGGGTILKPTYITVEVVRVREALASI